MAQFMRNNAAFYADIMSDEGVGVKTFSESTAKVADSTEFFANKRSGTKNQIAGVGSNMYFVDVGLRNRGVRPWERARYEANIRREKDQEFHRQRKASIAVINANKKKFHTETTTPTLVMPVIPVTSIVEPEVTCVCIDRTVIDAWDD